MEANEIGGLCEPDDQVMQAFPRVTADDNETYVHALNQVQNALDTWLSTSTERNIGLVEVLIDAALDAAAGHVQAALNVTTGDLAGIYFQGAEHDAVRGYFRRYVNREIAALVPDPTRL
ncbi:hypothetical protein SAMN05216345_111167 [Cupriavidus sp. YR651]|nr:hypothetical protein SAMN05216345_111167 [Cupriavidus sp. YR651]